MVATATATTTAAATTITLHRLLQPMVATTTATTTCVAHWVCKSLHQWILRFRAVFGQFGLTVCFSSRKQRQIGVIGGAEGALEMLSSSSYLWCCCLFAFTLCLLISQMGISDSMSRYTCQVVGMVLLFVIAVACCFAALLAWFCCLLPVFVAVLQLLLMSVVAVACCSSVSSVCSI